MNKDQKKEVVEQIAAQLQGAAAVYAVDYRGLTVTQAAELRTSLRETGTSFRVVKNTLTLRAADKAGAEPLKPLVEEGPTALAFVVDGDPALAAKVLDAFARRSQVIALKGGLLEGEPLDSEKLQRLARLPSREQLNAQLAGVVASPLATLVRGLGSLLSGLAVALGQVQQQRAAEAPPGEAPAPPAEARAPAEEAPAPADAAPAEQEASADEATASEAGREQQPESLDESEPEKEAE
jgi:large subunit ribosomal protein L10